MPAPGAGDGQQQPPSSPSLTGHTSHHRTCLPRLSPRAVLVVVSSLVSLLVLALSYSSTTQPIYDPSTLPSDAMGGNAGACRMSYSSPSYLHLESFGREYSRLGGGPWGLYLYREAGWDPEPLPAEPTDLPPNLQLTGTPVVFVPGNAGSFRQVRSLASAATRYYYSLPSIPRKLPPSHTNPGSRQLDFFTLDFNDDFSAFHGQTLLDQAEYLADSIRYILSLYHRSSLPDPTSLIVLAHSMGGVVARAAFLHPHFQAGSVSTLITFATPHTVPPASVDRGIDNVYTAINQYWRDAYSLSSVDPASPSSEKARAALQDLALISITGGLSDVMVSSESASTSSLLPQNASHGFTVFTTSIASIRTPVDHLAILWCNQLVELMAKALLGIVDVRRPEGVVGREERVRRLERDLVGVADPSKRLESGGRKMEFDGRKLMKVGERLVVRPTKRVKTSWVMPVPQTRSYGSAKVFSVVSNRQFGRKKEEVEVWACGDAPGLTKGGNDDQFGLEGSEAGGLCTALFPSHSSLLPGSPHGPIRHDAEPLSFITVDAKQLELEDKTNLVVVVKSEQAESTWVLAEFGDREKRVTVVEKSAFQLLLGGYRLEAFPTSPNLVSELWIPALDTSILSLKLRVFRSECQDTSSLFAPLIRQYSPVVQESKYFPNVHSALIYTHAAGPFQSRPISPFSAAGTHLQVFLDPTCASADGASDLAIELTVDIWNTLGSLLLRYRMAAVAFPCAIVLLVFATQLKEYNAGYHFMPFGTAFSVFTKRYLFPLLVVVTLLSFFQSIALGTHLPSASTNETSHLPHASIWVSDALLGNSDPFFVFLAAFVLFSCVGAVVLEHLVLLALVGGAAGLVRFIHAKGPKFLRSHIPLTEPRENVPTQRAITMGALLLLVLFFAPYQFAFLVIFLVQFFSTTRALLLAQDVSSPSTPASTKRLWDRYHYSFAVLFLMMSLIPLAALILVVWVRNLAVGWLAPFSSDHNVLNIVGFLLNAEALHSGKMIQRCKGRLMPLVSVLLPTAFALYSILYGIRYAHSIFPLANSLSIFLAVNNAEALVGAAYEVFVGKRRKSIYQPVSQGGGAKTTAASPRPLSGGR
ncbi:glycosylphosphatidylinositol deacylase [Pseudohyphozyma bogoriensis]|nr:glycosylphosphatidylinositol deacylase [Pseudohyphozyma bogoriensis]